MQRILFGIAFFNLPSVVRVDQLVGFRQKCLRHHVSHEWTVITALDIFKEEAWHSLIFFCYLVSLAVSDLTPNLGLFWYFFIEMFDQFRPFFLIVFQIHVFIFAVPISIKLR